MRFMPDSPLERHRQLRGKIEIQSKTPIRNAADLAAFYTPGVAAASLEIVKHPAAVRKLTIKANSVAVISDGSAVLGLGNIGPAAALPVMEGKAMLLKQLAGVDAFPLCLATQDTEAIIQTVKHIAPAFGGINLEDIAAPRCFEIERRLQAELDIPVVHDDQHATAIVVLAGLINAFKVVGKPLRKAKIIVLGAGAAGSGIAHLLKHYGVANLLVVDSKGILEQRRAGLAGYKLDLARATNRLGVKGSLSDALLQADAVVGVSSAGSLTSRHLKVMAKQPIVFAMANPEPEIFPGPAKAAGAAVVATGRSDFANQINNVLVFPGLFKGLLASGVKNITNQMKARAAVALAATVAAPSADRIIPDVFDQAVVAAVARSIR